jgi:hypothetical protein
MNAAQRLVHNALEEQKAKLGFVRALILKGRQQGISTYRRPLLPPRQPASRRQRLHSGP